MSTITPPVSNSATVSEHPNGDLSFKIILTTLIFISMLCLDFVWSLPGAFLILDDIQRHYSKEGLDENMLFVFNFRTLGYAAGICIGFMLDNLRKEKHRILFIIFILNIEMLTCISVSTSVTFNNIAGCYYIVGLGFSALHLAFCIYIFDMWSFDKSSHPLFLFLQFFSSLGKLFGSLCSRYLVNNHMEIDVNKTKTVESTEWDDVEYYPTVMFANAGMSGVIMVITLFWVLMLSYSTKKIFNREYREETEPPSVEFTTFALLTTFFLSFIILSVEYSYQVDLPSVAHFQYKMSSREAADLLYLFWIAHTIGALVSVAFSFVLHPFAIIVLQLLFEMAGAVILLQYDGRNSFSIFAGNAVLAFGLSNHRAATLLWLESYLHINHKILGILFLAPLTVEMIMIHVVELIRHLYGHLGICTFILSLPVIYSIIFASQLVVFLKQGEKLYIGQEEPTKRRIPIFVQRISNKKHSA